MTILCVFPMMVNKKIGYIVETTEPWKFLGSHKYVSTLIVAFQAGHIVQGDILIRPRRTYVLVMCLRLAGGLYVKTLVY